jgi:hypothetical protein
MSAFGLAQRRSSIQWAELSRGDLKTRRFRTGIRHRYEEFDDNHSDIDYRMDVSLPFLYRALRP